ncbi:MAG: pyridoxamine 5'-phosphate oxidase [Actinobacteria bacterium]|nr:pyridoxamine 5'-phosphate oxidase [Actinomycetota bacterium]MSW47220.1 pyridoxamine 5'-phosphate oxidase [Actinomycetota bacterium]MSX24235.1 pyridoxamine 5'-phosphate oxidase [Actinomycetota bacterium]MSY46649.1 pyridoxamine 5'-phosphate oxidase [Actinomycetota bacterium]MSY56706.1 pyridoxamine 5'-phosphate oxidase [Actinomycetota bacterium]
MARELTREEIAAMRRSYGQAGLEALPDDPFVAFAQWLAQAHDNPMIVEPNAMVLSTVNHDGAMSARTVLLKDISRNGFTFFTNYQSRKGLAIHSQPKVSLLFPWYAMERQLIIVGEAEQISREETEEYFATRPWGSKIGAWASRQSAPLASREELQERWDGAAAKWPEGCEVPTPPHWGGYRVFPHEIEFWQGRHSRLHDRLRYERIITDGSAEIKWQIGRFYP